MALESLSRSVTARFERWELGSAGWKLYPGGGTQSLGFDEFHERRDWYLSVLANAPTRAIVRIWTWQPGKRKWSLEERKNFA